MWTIIQSWSPKAESLTAYSHLMRFCCMRRCACSELVLTTPQSWSPNAATRRLSAISVGFACADASVLACVNDNAELVTKGSDLCEARSVITGSFFAKCLLCCICRCICLDLSGRYRKADPKGKDLGEARRVITVLVMLNSLLCCTCRCVCLDLSG